MFVRNSEFDVTISMFADRIREDRAKILNVNSDLDLLWEAVANLEAVVYADTPKPKKAPVAKKTVAAPSRTKSA